MANAEPADGNDSDDGFTVKECISIKHKDLKLQTVILPEFIKEHDDIQYTLMSIWRSRGVAALMGCRVDADTDITIIKKTSAAVVVLMRNAQVKAFQEAVLDAADSRHIKFLGNLVPKNTRLKAHAVMASDVVKFTMPAIDGVVEECVMTSFLESKRRRNRYNMLWLQLTPNTIDYISKAVAYHVVNPVEVNEIDVDGHEIENDDQGEAAPRTTQAIIDGNTMVEELPKPLKQARLTSFFKK